MTEVKCSFDSLELISIQYELTQSLDADLNLRDLCRHFMETCIRRLSVKAVHLYLPVKDIEHLCEADQMINGHMGRISMPKRSNCFPDALPQVSEYLQKQDEPLKSRATVAQVIVEDRCYHIFVLGDGAALVLERNKSVLPESIIRAVSPAVSYFFNMCQSSLRHLRVLDEVERRKHAEELLKYIAYHDELTGLPNRVQLINMLDKHILSCESTRQDGILVYVDLDSFRDINDSLGHVIGDELLLQVAERLGETLVEGETLARLASDEFIILCPSQYEPQARINQLLRAIRACFEGRFEIDLRSLEVNASIGVTHYNSHSESAYKVLMQCDLAMANAKQNAGMSIEFYQSEMEEQASRRFMLDSDMRKALHSGEFELVVQPQADPEGEIIGAECLTRWQHPELGFISPAEFIEIAEKTGFILPLGEWILDKACEYVAEVQAKSPSSSIRIAVNISAKQFYQSNFIQRISQALAHHGIDGSAIELELTESIMLENVQLAVKKLNILKSMNIEVSIDDFGTGYSSLSYLKQLPLDRVKVDRSFVTDIGENEDNRTIVEAIAMMAKRFDLKLIAEGVETEQERSVLTSIGCKEFQGYFFYKPMPFSNFLKLL